MDEFKPFFLMMNFHFGKVEQSQEENSWFWIFTSSNFVCLYEKRALKANIDLGKKSRSAILDYITTFSMYHGM
jgi:hypothetical protein